MKKFFIFPEGGPHHPQVEQFDTRIEAEDAAKTATTNTGAAYVLAKVLGVTREVKAVEFVSAE